MADEVKREIEATLALPGLQGVEWVYREGIQKASGRKAQVWRDEQGVPGGRVGGEREVGKPGFVKIKREAAQCGWGAVVDNFNGCGIMLPPPPRNL